MNDQSTVRRVNIALFVAQSVASAGFLSMVTVNPIVAQAMSGTAALAGIPSALIFVGAAISSYLAGKNMARLGRRGALILGAAVGILGAVLVSTSIQVWMFPLFMAALLVFGMGRGMLEQSRFAAAEVNPAEQRARAISIVVWGGTIGSVFGPQLTEPASQLAKSLGIAPLAGPSLATASFYVVAGLLFALLLAGVDFKGIARRLEAGKPAPPRSNAGRWPVFTVPRARAALISMVCGQSAMALMMTIISVHMKDHDMPLDQVGWVLSAHTLGMFAFSPAVGWLADRVGRSKGIVLGACILAAGCVVTAGTLNTPVIMFGEFLVGLGWSFCYVSGGALLTNSLAPDVRAASQGTNDLVVNMASALGALTSGLLLSAFGFYLVCGFGLVVSLLPILAVWRWDKPKTIPESRFAN